MLPNSVGDYEQLKAYDLIDAEGHTWEVKFDRLWHETLNVFVEREALEHSSAEYVVYFLDGDDSAYWIPRYKLLQAINSHAFPEVTGGDGNRSHGTLIPAVEFRGMCQRL